MMEMLVGNTEMGMDQSAPTVVDAFVDTVSQTLPTLGDRSYLQKEQAYNVRLEAARDIIQESGLSTKDKLALEKLISPNYGTQSSDQRKLVDAIIRLESRAESEYLAQFQTGIKREYIVDSILESIAQGSVELGQGNVASCTATSGGKIFMKHKGAGAYAELMTDLLLDGYHNLNGNSDHRIELNLSGVRLEADKGLHKGATVAESIFRASVMEFSCRGLEAADPRMNFRYDDTTGSTFIFDQKGEQVGSFAGMYMDGWTYSMERMMGCGVEFMSSKNDKDGKFSSGQILRELMECTSGAGIEIAYARSGPHNRHFCVFSHVENGRVYFDNPHSDLNQDNFSAKSDSHRLEANGLESMSIADFKARLLSASIVRDGTEIGSFDATNKAQQEWRSTESVVNWFLGNRHAHVYVQASAAELHAMTRELEKDNKKESDDFKFQITEEIFDFKREEDLPVQELNKRHKIEEEIKARLLLEQTQRYNETMRERFGLKMSLRPSLN